MSRRTGHFAVAGVLAIEAVTGLGTAPVASAAETAGCPDVDIAFARGTLESPGLGVVGTPLLPAVQRALPGTAVTAHAVDYAASLDQSSAAPVPRT